MIPVLSSPIVFPDINKTTQKNHSSFNKFYLDYLFFLAF